MHTNAIASPIDWRDRMELYVNQLVQRNAIRLREAHLKRFAYLELKPLRSKDGMPNRRIPEAQVFVLEPRNPDALAHFDAMESKDAKSFRHFYRSPTGWCQYSGETLRAMRDANGCGKIPKERPRRFQQQMKTMLPWNAKDVIVSFDIRNGDDGKPYFSDVKLLKLSGRHARNKRLENSLTDEQWHALYQQMARRLRAGFVPLA